MTSENSNLTSLVYQRLRDDILNGAYAPGTALTELALSRELSVSRTPVREALRLLELSELVKITPNKSAVVTGINQDDIRDVYEIRSLIEGVAASRAAVLASEEDIAALEEIIDLTGFYLERGNNEKLQGMDGRFHDKIYNMSGSKMLCHVLTDLHSYVSRFRAISLMKSGRAKASLGEHRAILEAIKHHDAERAKELSTIHVKNAAISLLDSSSEK